MNICAVEPLPFDGLTESYNLVIVASGYESRARYVAEILGKRNITIANKVVFSFEEHKQECARPENDVIFKKLGYTPVISCGGSDEEVLRTLVEAYGKLEEGSDVRILVDISSMTRVWYGAVVRSLMSLQRKGNLVVHFAYTGAEFCPPANEYPPNRVVAPVAGFAGNTLPDKPTALIMGLGYDKDRAIGLKDHLDPQLTVLFYADPASDDRFMPHVLNANKDLINEVGEDCLFTYPFTDGAATFRFLESVCKGLTHEWRVVLCSLGPKNFGLCSFLVASLLRDVSIWRVSADLHEVPFDHKPIGTPTILQTTWK